jgi:hypothetical protein
MAGDGSDHPDLGTVGAEMRSAWQAEQESATADAAAQWRHGRRLEDWLLERMHAGDRIAVAVLNQRFSGLVEEVSEDLIGVRAVFGRIDVHYSPGIPVFIEIEQHAVSGGERSERRRSFHEALAERDGRDDLSVGTVHEPEGLDGTLYVGQNFVSVVTRMGAETVVPFSAIAWVAPRR